MQHKIIPISAVIDYIESHLFSKIDLNQVAEAVNYSKFHLHRIFTETVGLSIHDYVQRRQLSEAAKLLVFTKKPIIEIAQTAGYESQQAFTTIFKHMYKKTPFQYRSSEEFYPLQLRYVLNSEPTKTKTGTDYSQEILFASESDIPAWMDLVRIAVDGFPYLNESDHEEQLRSYIQKKQAVLLWDQDIMIAAMTCSKDTGSIDFLAVHPQYRKTEIVPAFLAKAWDILLQDTLFITTFRDGDKADLGYRSTYKKLGFAEAELLIEFGYPTQKLILNKADAEVSNDE